MVSLTTGGGGGTSRGRLFPCCTMFSSFGRWWLMLAYSGLSFIVSRTFSTRSSLILFTSRSSSVMFSPNLFFLAIISAWQRVILWTFLIWLFRLVVVLLGWL